MESYFVDPMGHKVPSTSRYIVKMFCKDCQKIWDKRDCRKIIIQNGQIIVKQRGQIIQLVNT